MKNYLQKLEKVVLKKNDKGNKVEQKQSRVIKKGLVNVLSEYLSGSGFSVKYDVNGKPVMVFKNGLIVGFDFVVKNLDSELYENEPQ